MRPHPEEVLRAVQAGIMAHFAPELRTDYARAQFAFSLMLFSIIQRDYDTAVPDLIEANHALRELLSEAPAAFASVTHDLNEKARDPLSSLPEPAASLKLSDLRRENEALRAVVARIAPLVEPAADENRLTSLVPLREKVFDYLAADARRRVVPVLSA